MLRYIALIRKEPDSDYGVDFPDFPGCITAGSTLDEAFAMAEEALQFHVEGLEEDGAKIPEPRGLESVLADPDLAGAVAVLIPLRRQKGRAMPVRITLDEHLLADIDAEAARLGLSRSAYLAEAARAKLKTEARQIHVSDEELEAHISARESVGHADTRENHEATARAFKKIFGS